MPGSPKKGTRAKTPKSPTTSGKKTATTVAKKKETTETKNDGADTVDNSGALYIVYLLIVLYALCYQFQSPIEPFLLEKLLNNTSSEHEKASLSTTYANLKSFFSIIQGVGSLIFGAILDKFGVRTGLIINFLACASCYYTLSICDSVELLYLSKLPGLAMAGFLCAQTAVIKLTKPGPQRLNALGRLTTSYTIGGTLGPFLGGKLGASGDYYVGARCATAGSLLAVALVFLLPSKMDNNIDESKKSDENKSTKKDASWCSKVSSILSLVWIFLFVKLTTSISNSMARSSQPLILKSLGADESMMGTVMAVQFGFGGFACAFLLSPVTRLMGGHVSKVVKNCVLVMGVVYLIQSALYSEAMDQFNLVAKDGLGRQRPFIIIAMVLALFQFSLGTSITENTSEIVPREYQGTLMGMEHAVS
jgi:MFS family permease